jgi:hypothetical protein
MDPGGSWSSETLAVKLNVVVVLPRVGDQLKSALGGVFGGGGGGGAGAVTLST